ncbi:MAG: glutamine synthetase [Solirubrobacterales bacterium]|nr:glutamine synthetase [Solirubrobacterales bacterium]
MRSPRTARASRRPRRWPRSGSSTPGGRASPAREWVHYPSCPNGPTRRRARKEEEHVNLEAATRAAPAAGGALESLSPAVSTIRTTYSDLHGSQRGKDVPLGELERAREHGLAFCWAVMGTDLRHTPVVGGERGYPDMLARPDLSTLVELPWEPDVAACLADLERDGEPEPTDMRGLVRRAEAALAELGRTAKIGPELEFFVLEPDGEGGWRRHVDNLSMVYTVGPQADPRGVLKGMLDGCAALGIGAIAANHEYMNSQYEINLAECAPLEASDNAFRLKAAVKDYAAQRGLLATFMGKPFNDQGGSGTHVHLSLESEGANCFDDPAGGDGLSVDLRRFTAGVLDHAPALMAFLNPTVNAYRRILPDSLAPTHANWGLDNRTTFVRIPPDRGPGCRIELRVGDGAANPYLVTAAVIFAGIDGLRRELEPPALLAGDTYTLPEDEQGAPLPMSLSDALDALEADTALGATVGAEIVDTFLAMKRFEVERYRQHVSEWDLAEYLHHL